MDLPVGFRVDFRVDFRVNFPMNFPVNFPVSFPVCFLVGFTSFSAMKLRQKNLPTQVSKEAFPIFFKTVQKKKTPDS